MKKQVKEGLYWFSERDYRARQAVKVWFNKDTFHRGWYCTPFRDGEAHGLTYPLSPDIWSMLKSETEMQSLTGEVLMD